MRKKLLSITLAAMMSLGCAAPAFAADTLTVTLDPGHGYNDFGATKKSSGKMYYEKKMTLSIAKAMKKELETYKNVKVYMTRTNDSYNPTLPARAKIAQNYDSDLFMSIHINSVGSAQSYKDGISALVSSGQYHKELAESTWTLSDMIMTNVQDKVGIKKRGLLKRTCTGYKYPNGKYADYYGIIRNGTNAGMPTVLVEHGFISSSKDLNVLKSSSNLTKIGKADATAVAQYYGLDKKDGSVKYQPKGPKVKYLSQHWMLKDKRYYYVYNNGSYAKSWKTINSNRYYFGKSGAAFVGQKKIGAGLYRFSNRGIMYVNKWGKTNGEMYYYGKDGKALKSCTKKINGKKYKFNATCICTNYR